MSGSDPAGSGLAGSLRRLSATVLAVVQNRIELALVELQEERSRFFDTLLLAAVVVGGGFLTVTAATMTLLVLVWQRYRLAGLVAVSVVFLLVTVLSYLRLRARLRRWTAFPATLAELKKDRACLEDEL